MCPPEEVGWERGGQSRLARGLLPAKAQLNVTISERNLIKTITRICKPNMLNSISINYFRASFEKKYFTERGTGREDETQICT